MIYAAENKMEKLIHDPEQEVQVTIEIVNPDIFEAVAAKKKKRMKGKIPIICLLMEKQSSLKQYIALSFENHISTLCKKARN